MYIYFIICYIIVKGDFMRLRNVKGSREQIAANEYTIKDAEQIKGQWKDYFQDGKPIQLEIGMGKGKFLMQLAEKNPQIHYIGIEKYSSVLVRALEKMEENPLENLHFIRMDAENIVNVFEKGEVDQIYLNFSDPWPKDRHAKRRLTSRQFLERYHNILKEEGITAIMVTHDIGEAASISSKVIVMSKRPSKIKNVYLMDYQDVLKPLERRKSPLFNLYYDKLWRDIDEGK